MGEKKKIIFKSFDYMHCDDFAKILNDMAAKGWHFKEWGWGLKFEKGEPENATYAVEVFTKASENDMRPEPHTQEFAEYCEAAGWKFIDAKQKFCIFKKVDKNAVELFTSEERVTNSFKAMMSGSAIVLLILYALNALSQWQILFRFEQHIFSGLFVFSFSVWNVLFLEQLCTLLHVCWKKYRWTKDIREGKEVYVGNKKDKCFISCRAIFLLLLLVILIYHCYLIGRIELPIISAFLIGIILIFSMVVAKIRPESNLNSLLQVGMGFILILTLVIFTAITIFDDNEKISIQKEELPLLVSDYRAYTEEIEEITIVHDVNFLGSIDTYVILDRKNSISYDIYQSEYTKILDKIWEKQLEKKGNQDTIDCTKEWEAKTAVRNPFGVYYVRYENSILVLRENKDVYLDTEQIAIICDKLGIR